MPRQGCSLSILHRACENMHWGVGLRGFGMPNILHSLFILSLKSIRNYSVIYVMQIEFAYICIKSWIIDSNVDGFFNGSLMQ